MDLAYPGQSSRTFSDTPVRRWILGVPATGTRPEGIGSIRSRAKRINDALITFATLAAPLVLLVGLGACDRRGEVEQGRATTSSSAPAPAAPTIRYVYGDWSEWQVDCSRRASDPNVLCAAVRKRICLIEGTSEGVQ